MLSNFAKLFSLATAGLCLQAATLPSARAGEPAAQSVKVIAVSAPAWLQRNGVSYPLEAGKDIVEADIVSIGAGGSAVLRLDANRLILQENSIWRLQEPTSEKSELKLGALLEGKAGIDTTSALPNSPPVSLILFEASEHVLIEAGTFAGAMTSSKEATVCLATGKARFGNTALSGQEELRHNLLASSPESPSPPLPEPSNCLSLAASELQGLWLTQDGGWQVNLLSSTDARTIQSLYTHLRKNGYAVKIDADGGAEQNNAPQRLYPQRLYLPGFATQRSASAMALQLIGRLPGVNTPWVTLSSPPIAALAEPGLPRTVAKPIATHSPTLSPKNKSDKSGPKKTAAPKRSKTAKASTKKRPRR